MSLIAATATFIPGDVKRLVDLYVQVKLFTAVGKAQSVVAEEAKAICPVDTGTLRDSIREEPIDDDGKQVTAQVSANTHYAAFVEFGTGRRGAESAGAGPFNYTMSWPGMVAQPYLRPALDSARSRVMEQFGL
jgi:HK97 gp10 family phage protein